MKDATLRRIVREFRNGILGRDSSRMMCFAVCAPLAGFLEAYGLKVKVRKGTVAPGEGLGTCNHYWLELEDGRVVDPTADQFNHWFEKKLPGVYLGAPTEIHRSDAG